MQGFSGPGIWGPRCAGGCVYKKTRLLRSLFRKEDPTGVGQIRMPRTTSRQRFPMSASPGVSSLRSADPEPATRLAGEELKQKFRSLEIGCNPRGVICLRDWPTPIVRTTSAETAMVRTFVRS